MGSNSKEYNRAYRKANRDKLNAKCRKWYHENKGIKNARRRKEFQLVPYSPDMLHGEPVVIKYPKARSS